MSNKLWLNCIDFTPNAPMWVVILILRGQTGYEATDLWIKYNGEYLIKCHQQAEVNIDALPWWLISEGKYMGVEKDSQVIMIKVIRSVTVTVMPWDRKETNQCDKNDGNERGDHAWEDEKMRRCAHNYSDKKQLLHGVRKIEYQ